MENATDNALKDEKNTNGNHTRALLYQYDNNDIDVINLPLNLDAISIYMNQGKKCWIHINGLTNLSFISSLCTGFGIHNSVIEDILNTKKSSKAEYYDDYIFVVLQAVKHLSEETQVEYEQVSFILMENTLISFTLKPMALFDMIIERLKRPTSNIRAVSVDYLLYTLINSILDEYIEMIEIKVEMLNLFEEKLTQSSEKFTLNTIYQLRRDLLYLQYNLKEFRDVTNSLYHIYSQSVSSFSFDHSTDMKRLDILKEYLQNLSGHIVKALDRCNLYRDLSKDMLETYLSNADKLSKQVNLLTILCAIFIPLIIIAGTYGIIFTIFSEINNIARFFTLMFIMLVVGLGLLTVFKVKKWF
ncbi:hypothetical protein L3V79_00385 [Thiotrichales bacterium 19S9-12]|nr:hypothetical protein [Thiotrichales bacterium 19S9-11]MCF6810823.1 hypothetical protein [Thiotrichales bacterium 19S9-12]